MQTVNVVERESDQDAEEEDGGIVLYAFLAPDGEGRTATTRMAYRVDGDRYLISWREAGTDNRVIVAGCDRETAQAVRRVVDFLTEITSSTLSVSLPS